MSISAIVPVWNGRDLLARLLASLAAQTTPAAEVLVVDNGSHDGAPALACQRGARVIAMGRNAGFAAAVNRGIREARGEWIAVLNSDVELAPDYFEKLLAARAPFATGKILQRAQSTIGATPGATPAIDATFDALCRGAAAWRVGSGRPDGPIFSQELAIASPPWTAVLFRADVFPRAGWLEETFESYLEDVDFGLRCAALDIRGRYVPTALAWHLGSAALGRWHPETVRRIARNQLLLLARHYPSRLVLRWLWPILVAQLLWGAVALRHGTGFAWLRGKWQGLSGFATARGSGRRLDAEFLKRWLPENERRIYEIQQATGFDSYWKLYFFLTRGGTK
jgi:GT2 family glycosyltransferase